MLGKASAAAVLIDWSQSLKISANTSSIWSVRRGVVCLPQPSCHMVLLSQPLESEELGMGLIYSPQDSTGPFRSSEG